ncbi:MAG TPA: acyl-ACP desaturase [Pseudonocardiaceae bacterium]|nr:acyl-ACP desaturase [Pseudonocardiaceae bacterium]
MTRLDQEPRPAVATGTATGQTRTGLAPLDLSTARAAVEPVVARGVDRAWSLTDLDWSAVRPELLTDADRSVVRFITYIEDHIPGYLSWLLRSFPVDGAHAPVPQVAVHREYFRFFVAWANDEERHASALTRYQEAANINTPEALRLELAEEGRKHFDQPYTEALETFTYTLLQEKATQLFYQRFRAVVAEPVLRDLLTRLARDEARHFGLYANLVEAYLRRDPRAAAPYLKEVLRTFRMPLADTLPRYRRWSLEVADAAGYDHTEAYTALGRLVDRYANAPGEADLNELLTLISTLRTMP